MPKEVDITGQKFNMLTAIKRAENYRPTGVYWLCRCECGREVVVKKYDLIHLRVFSCNCYQKKCARKNHIKHNGRYTKLYPIWVSMKQRCFNENNYAFKNYGARGITVCDEWKNSFQAFYDWAINNGYKDGLSIDRIDNNKGYSPNNCRWATAKEQANNRRGVRKITCNGETHSPAEWSRITGIGEATIKNRIFSQNLTPEEALTSEDRRTAGIGKRWKNHENVEKE